MDVTVEHKYEAGQVYAFKTEPATSFSMQETGRYGTLKVLGVKNGGIYHVILDGVFDHKPSANEVERLPHLKMSPKGVVCRVADKSWKNELKGFSLIRMEPLSSLELQLFATCENSGPWINSALIIEIAWRRLHDKAALEREIAKEKAILEEKMCREQRDQQSRLMNVTWKTLLEETLFARWEQHPPFPSPEITRAFRDRVLQCIKKLQALGSKPQKQEVRTILKELVDWFGMMNTELGGIIETEEREDLYNVLVELAHVTGHERLSGEIVTWLKW